MKWYPTLKKPEHEKGITFTLLRKSLGTIHKTTNTVGIVRVRRCNKSLDHWMNRFSIFLRSFSNREGRWVIFFQMRSEICGWSLDLDSMIWNAAVKSASIRCSKYCRCGKERINNRFLRALAFLLRCRCKRRGRNTSSSWDSIISLIITRGYI